MFNVIQKTTPNFTKGRGTFKPEMVVMHIMAGTLSGSDDWFSKSESKVSAHYGVGVGGEIHQYVREDDTAWHAGVVKNPTFKLYKPSINPNLYTIGIEHEGYDLSKAPKTQLQASADLLKDICTRWSIPMDRDHVIGHQEVTTTRPTCPSSDLPVLDFIISMNQEKKGRMKEDFLIDQIINELNMFENYSLTYAGVIIVVVAKLAEWMGLQIGSAEITTTVMTLVQLGGALVALYGRFRKGDINIWGLKI